MRFSTHTIAALVSCSGVALADDTSTKVVLTPGGPAQHFSGTLKQGETKSFTYTVSTDRLVTLIIHARNEDCGAEMSTDADLSFMPYFGWFPATRVERARAGETFKVSFHQTRTAWMNKVACDYSIAIR